jgi:hypothetical protein
VVRAVAASLSVAVVGAIAYLIYDIELSRGAQLPGGDLRLLALVAYTVLVLVIGSVVTYFVVPILAFEKLGPIASVKRSGEIIKRTWGESLVGAVGLGALTFLLFLPGVALIAFGFWRAAQGHPEPNWTPLGLSLLFALGYFIVVGLVTSALKQIFIAGTYVYATRGQIAPGFSAETVGHAFLGKK